MESSEIFQQAAAHARKLGATLSSTQMLQLYGLYKQAIEGPNRTPRPSWINRTDRSKWDAWAGHGEKKSSDAMLEYVDLVNLFDPDWKDSISNDPSSGSWVHHSCLLPEVEESLPDTAKSVFDWVKENNVENLRKTIASGADVISVSDSEGLNALHWAADRGHLEVLRCLLDVGIPVDVADADGQTPLHYASSCGHAGIVSELLAAGACPSLADADGATPKDVAASEEIVQLLMQSV